MSDLQKTAASSLDTLAVRGGEPRAHAYHSVSMPIACAATYAFADTQAVHDHFAGRHEQHEYGRYGNPTVETAERKLAALEGAQEAVLFPSGMSAVTTLLFAMLRPGDHIVLTNDLYRRTRQFVVTLLARYGVTHSFVEPGDYPAMEQALARPNTRIFLTEAPSNPYLRIVDVARVAGLCKLHPRVKLVVDATLATPINFRPLAHGAHVVLHSCTKYLGGHNDLLAGALCGDTALLSALREARGLLGGMPDAHGAYLLIRGMKTLHVRMRQHNQSGLEIARVLAQHPRIERVYYPGLDNHPDHAVASHQFDGFGGVISFLVKADLSTTSRFVDACRIASIGASMGAVETLIQQPALMAHAELSPEERAAIGAYDNLVRLSVGLESSDDLIVDLTQALDAIAHSDSGAVPRAG
jgi:cystathionine gamma-synthase